MFYAVETLNHRAFSPDPRYKLAVTFFAVVVATLGMLPIVFHLSPRVGRVTFLTWLGAVILLLDIGFVTKP
jgi:hypothetical protein